MCRKEFPGHSLCRHMYVPEGMSSVVWVYTFGSALFFLHVRVCTFVSAREIHFTTEKFNERVIAYAR